MKRFLCFICVAVLFLPVLRAQIGERRSVLSLGGSAGITLSSIDFDPTIKQNQLIRPTMGLTLRYTCEKYFSTVCALQMELNYVQMGWSENILNRAGEPLPDTYERSVGYVQLPLLARLSWGREQRGLMFFVMAGPQFGLYMNDKAKQSDTWTINSEGNPDRPNNVFQQYAMDPQHKFDYGLTGGLGVELNTKIGRFDLEGRYYFGLSDLYNNSKKDVFARSAHRSIMIKMSYLFDLFNEDVTQTSE